jgi:hypothetical protein
MENKKNVQQELINFICSTLNAEKIKLLKMENKHKPTETFTSYKKFVSHNTEIVNSLSDDELEFHLGLMNLIKSREIKLLDQEDFYENDACGFYFSPTNMLVVLWNE